MFLFRNCEPCGCSLENKARGLTPKIVQDQQKKAEYIYFLSCFKVHHNFQVPLEEESSESSKSKATIPSLGQPSGFLVSFSNLLWSELTHRGKLLPSITLLELR